MSRWIPLSRCQPLQLQRVAWRWRRPHISSRIEAQEEHHLFVGWVDGYTIQAVTPKHVEVLVYVSDDDPRVGYPRISELEWQELEEQCHICGGDRSVLASGGQRTLACYACQ